MKIFIQLFVLVLLIVSLKNTNAQPGTLDTTFSNDGIVTTDFGSNEDYGNAVCLQTDGNIIIIGQGLISNNNYQYILGRYLFNGTLDTTFGIAGKVLTNFGSSFEGAKAGLIQPDGKIIAAGFVFNAGYQFLTARYNSNGSLDTSFNMIGFISTNMNGALGETVALQEDGKVIVGGGLWDFAIIRYNQNGILDTTFGTGGKVFTNFGMGGDKIQSLIIQPDYKIIAGGYAPNPITDYDFAVSRYTISGILDSSFSNDGKATYDIGQNSEDYASDMEIQTDGKILLGGYFSNVNDIDFAIIRINSDGSIDSSFGANGKATFDFFNSDNYLNAISLQSDGKILLTGFNYYGSSDEIIIIRLLSNGLVDITFGNGGIVITHVNNIFDEAYDILLQPDGKIVLGGAVQYAAGNIDMAVLRYNNNIQAGVIDLTVYNSPLLIYPNPVKQEATIQYKLNENESIIISINDMEGRRVQTFKKGNQSKGDHIETLHFSKNILPGTYIVSITNMKGNIGANAKIIVE